jgi:hypothetical protein
MKKKDRFIKATVLFEMEFYLDKETEPEDVFNDMIITADHGFITKSQVKYTTVTKKEKIK